MIEVGLVQNQLGFPTDVDAVLDSIDKLSAVDKMRVVEQLVGKNAGLSVVLGNSAFDIVVAQISLMPVEHLPDVLDAVASRMRCEFSR